MPVNFGRDTIMLFAGIGIVVCGGWTIVSFGAGLWKEGLLWTLFTGCNVLTIYRYRRKR